MTEDEYAGYRARAVPLYADELVRSKGMSREEAEKNSATTFPATVADVLAEAGASISRVLADDEPVGLAVARPRREPTACSSTTSRSTSRTAGAAWAGRRCSPPRTWPRAAGHRFVRLNVFGWNTSAQALYRSLGYRTDSIQMSKPLEEPT